MATSILGIDISKHKYEVALPKGEKVKNKSFSNTTEGFEALTT